VMPVLLSLQFLHYGQHRIDYSLLLFSIHLRRIVQYV
jgi:hypothetical protein